MKRRQFLAVPFLLILSGCVSRLTAPAEEQQAETAKGQSRNFIAPDSAAAFLDSKFGTSYQNHLYSDWLLLVALGSWGPNDYKYYIDGEYKTSPINLTSYNPRQQKLTITLEDDTFIWEHKPHRRGTHYIPHEEVPAGRH